MKDVATGPSPTIRVAAVQMMAELANVDANLAKAERLVRVAFERGANWVILPEFFSSGMAFHPEMARASRAIDGPPAELLRDLARQGNATVGGSFLAWRDGNVYNSFVLALPDGSTHRHDKDYPTFWENCYYIGGNDDGVLPTPQGNVGVALCWEFIRSRTAVRLKGKVAIVVGGSGWWAPNDSVSLDNPARKVNLEIMKATPSRFAKMLVFRWFTRRMQEILWDSPGLTRATPTCLTTSVRLRSLMARAAFLRACLVKKAKGLSRRTSRWVQ